MLSLRALACVATAFFVTINEAKKAHLVQEFNSRSDVSQSPQDPIIGNWSNLTANDNFTASITFQNGGFVGTWLSPSPRGSSAFACSPYTPGPWAYSCYFFDLGVLLANISSSSSGWRVTWSDSSIWGPKAASANVSQVQANLTLTGVSLASLSPTQQTSLRNSVGAAIAAEAGVSPNAVSVTLTQVSFLLLSQVESSQTGSILVTATISGVPTSSSSTLSRSLSSSSTLPSSVSTSIKTSTGLTVTTGAVSSTVVQTVSQVIYPTWATYTGTGPFTYSEAVSTCSALGGSLCTRAQYCINNQINPNIRGSEDRQVSAARDNWAPYLDVTNGWIHTSNTGWNTCVDHNLDSRIKSAPGWGLTGSSYGTTMCCQLSVTWTVLYTTGSSYFPLTQLAKDAFNAAVQRSTGIVRRECSSCSNANLKDVYYRRKDGLSTWDAYEHLMVTWTADGWKTKYDLFSSLSDAQAGKNPWAFCNGGDPGVGFPRDCGPTGAIGGMWNSLSKGGQSSYRFSVLR